MRKILLVDDNRLILTALSDAFAGDYEVVRASSGEEAVGILASVDSRFDLIITDLNMPGMSGYELATYVKGTNVYNKFIPVILLTSSNVTKEEARKYGCSACLSKTDLNRVVSMTHILLPRAQSGSADPQSGTTASQTGALSGPGALRLELPEKG
jgi:CheY-like chemotaxis protein